MGKKILENSLMCLIMDNKSQKKIKKMDFLNPKPKSLFNSKNRKNTKVNLSRNKIYQNEQNYFSDSKILNLENKNKNKKPLDKKYGYFTDQRYNLKIDKIVNIIENCLSNNDYIFKSTKDLKKIEKSILFKFLKKKFNIEENIFQNTNKNIKIIANQKKKT